MRAALFYSSNVPKPVRQFSQLRRALGLESEEPNAVIEPERLMFAKIKNIADLAKAATAEKQEQYEIKIPKTDKNALGGKIRVRRSEPVAGGEVTYTLTSKTELPPQEGETDGMMTRSLEVNEPVSEKIFQVFQYLAEGGMQKTRFTFPIEGTELKWEFDVFSDSKGNYQDWCKIDLELPEGGLAEFPPFPIELERVISNPKGQRTEEEEAILDTLFSTVFKFNNPHL